MFGDAVSSMMRIQKDNFRAANQQERRESGRRSRRNDAGEKVNGESIVDNEIKLLHESFSN